MVDVNKLLEYNRIERHAFFEKFTGLPWEEFTKNREASFHSIRNIFIHTLNAIDFWLDFLQKQNLCSKKRFEEYKSYDDVRTYMEQVEKRMRSYLESLSLGMLSEKLKVHGKGEAEITTEDILVHVFEEELLHRGELIALLWQMNIEPPLVGYPPKPV
ncbi:MAG: DinB family protein [Promethearchaeati archaeon SRVP18_Atabeyarchaeia-1]